MLLVREPLGLQDDGTVVFRTAFQKPEIWHACQMSVTAVGERSSISASCRREKFS